MKEQIKQVLVDCVRETNARADVSTRWLEPLMGFAEAEDPLFSTLRQIVSPTHALPTDLLPGARTVVVFFLPFEREVAVSNYGGRMASEGWARAYVETNRLVAELCELLRSMFESHGHETYVTPATHNYDPVRMVSDWSHRHVAYVTGLGTLGVHNLLITARGACGRLGSCITTAVIEPDQRPEHEACLHKRGGTCLRCVKRCVAEALLAESFDRRSCQDVLRENEATHAQIGKADVCGKCVVKVPCAHAIPRLKAPG
jgi:epoxyqueuosine reductase QueG